jgi:hypothetical protein
LLFVGDVMKKAALAFLFGMLVLPAASARASSICPANAPAESRYCTISSSAITVGSGSPFFAVNRDGRGLGTLLGMSMFSFNATYTGKFGGVSSLVATAGSKLPSAPGRQGIGSEGDGGGAYGLSSSMFGSAPDGWFRHPSSDGWVRYQGSWDPGYSGSNLLNTSSDPLDPTPEPVTLVLFGTGLFLIAFLARRAGAAREDI